MRWEYPHGTVTHYVGAFGAERVVREEDDDGTVSHYEGEQDAERMVRIDTPGRQRDLLRGRKG